MTLAEMDALWEKAKQRLREQARPRTPPSTQENV